jgi:hypothetical protein
MAGGFFLPGCPAVEIMDPVREKEYAMEASCLCLECRVDAFRCRSCLKNCNFCRVPERRRDASRPRYCGKNMWWNMPKNSPPRQGGLLFGKR